MFFSRHLLSILLLQFLLLIFNSYCYANPLVLSEGNIENIRESVIWGNLVILFFESLGTGSFLKIFRYKIVKTVLCIFIINLATYSLFYKYLIVYSTYDIYISFKAEAAIIIIESLSVYLICKTKYLKSDSVKQPNLIFLLIALFVSNIISCFAGWVWSFEVAESVAYQLNLMG